MCVLDKPCKSGGNLEGGDRIAPMRAELAEKRPVEVAVWVMDCQAETGAGDETHLRRDAPEKRGDTECASAPLGKRGSCGG